MEENGRMNIRSLRSLDVRTKGPPDYARLARVRAIGFDDSAQHFFFGTRHGVPFKIWGVLKKWRIPNSPWDSMRKWPNMNDLGVIGNHHLGSMKILEHGSRRVVQNMVLPENMVPHFHPLVNHNFPNHKLKTCVSGGYVYNCICTIFKHTLKHRNTMK